MSLLGEGGVGQIWRARDTKLNCEAAIKNLPDLFAHDADRVARFTRDSRTLAAPTPPNGAQIHRSPEEAASTATPA